MITQSQLKKGRRRHVTLLEAHYAALDHEVLRRKSHGEDVTEDGIRINMNRSIIIRQLIEENIPLPPGWRKWE